MVAQGKSGQKAALAIITVCTVIFYIASRFGEIWENIAFLAFFGIFFTCVAIWKKNLRMGIRIFCGISGAGVFILLSIVLYNALA